MPTRGEVTNYSQHSFLEFDVFFIFLAYVFGVRFVITRVKEPVFKRHPTTARLALRTDAQMKTARTQHCDGGSWKGSSTHMHTLCFKKWLSTADFA